MSRKKGGKRAVFVERQGQPLEKEESTTYHIGRGTSVKRTEVQFDDKRERVSHLGLIPEAKGVWSKREKKKDPGTITAKGK